MSHSKLKKSLLKKLNKQQRHALLYIPYKSPPCHGCPALAGEKCKCAKKKIEK